MNLYIFLCVVYVIWIMHFFIDADWNVSPINILILHMQTSEISVMVNWKTHCALFLSCLFFFSFSDKTTSSYSVQTFTLASGLQGNWVRLCDFTQKKIVFVKYTTCRIKYSFKCRVLGMYCVPLIRDIRICSVVF